MALLDVNALIALAWDSHIHHVAMREWFAANAADGWATCSITEGGFVRAGQPLYQIDPSLYQAAVDQAGADAQATAFIAATSLARSAGLNRTVHCDEVVSAMRSGDVSPVMSTA